jgi:ferredoxin
MQERPIHFKVNGTTVQFLGDPDTRLIDVLRNQLKLTGTKDGCGEGVCGACTVLLDGKPVRACVIAMDEIEGMWRPLRGSGARRFLIRCSGLLSKKAPFNVGFAPRG